MPPLFVYTCLAHRVDWDIVFANDERESTHTTFKFFLEMARATWKVAQAKSGGGASATALLGFAAAIAVANVQQSGSSRLGQGNVDNAWGDSVVGLTVMGAILQVRMEMNHKVSSFYSASQTCTRWILSTLSAGCTEDIRRDFTHCMHSEPNPHPASTIHVPQDPPLHHHRYSYHIPHQVYCFSSASPALRRSSGMKSAMQGTTSLNRLRCAQNSYQTRSGSSSSRGMVW